jgi:cytochrome c oxidase subunit II
MRGIIASLASAVIVLASPAGAADTIVVTASSNDFAFHPRVLVLRKDVPVTLLFKADSGAHGIDVPRLGIHALTIASTTGTRVRVTPRKAGTYDAHCTVFCGAGHEHMILRFIVR